MAEPEFEIERSADGPADGLRLRLTGALDWRTCEPLKKQGLDLLNDETGDVEIDWSEVSSVAGTNLQVLLALEKDLGDQGRTLEMTSLTKPVVDMFTTFGLTRWVG